MKTCLKFKSNKLQDTIRLGEKLGDLLSTPQTILLTGNLGSGKTVFVKGIARGLDIEVNVNSPSYTLIKEYMGRMSLYHMDLYRLDEEEDLYNIGFEEYLYSDGVVVIEWPELARDLLPEKHIVVNIKVIGESKRQIEIKADGEVKKGLLSYVNHRY